MNNKQVSVIVSSCDKYEDAWKPFFFFFKKYWPDCPFRVYLITETKKYYDPDNKIISLNVGTGITWSARLKKALKKIDSKYVIFLLEDFFLLSNVNQKEIDRCIDIMDKDRKIAVIDWEYVERIKTNPSPYEGYAYRDRSAMYFLNCQSALWRRKDLISFLSPYEDAWQFEFYGSERAKLFSKEFLCMNSPLNPVFVYNVNWNTGYGLHKGKWLESNIKLFNDYNIHVDFDKLGFESKSSIESICKPPRKCAKDRIYYFLYGGFDGQFRMSIYEQISMLFSHRKEFLRAAKKKIAYLFTNRRAV